MEAQYSHLITFRLNPNHSPHILLMAYWQTTFRTVEQIPSIDEWNNFIEKHREKLSSDFIVLNQLTVKIK